MGHWLSSALREAARTRPLKLSFAFALVANYLYVPLHLAAEVHLSEFESSIAGGGTASWIAEEDHDHHPHEAHPASDHQIPVVSPERAPLGLKCFVLAPDATLLVGADTSDEGDRLRPAFLLPRPIPPPLPPQVRAPPSFC